MHRLITSALVLASLLARTHASAQEQIVADGAAAAPAVATLTYNLGLASDYRYRGISQTRLRPALQGGADYTHAGDGLYAGTWLSTIGWTKDDGGGGHVEWDLYAGKRGDLGGGFSYDVGGLAYVYPDNGLGRLRGYADANTFELYGQVGYGPAYVKYSNAPTNLFGFPDSRYSSYLDAGAGIDAGDGVTLILHAGRQHVAHIANASYTDFKLGVAKAWGPTTATLALFCTNAQRAAYSSPVNGKYLGRNGVVLSVVRTF